MAAAKSRHGGPGCTQATELHILLPAVNQARSLLLTYLIYYQKLKGQPSGEIQYFWFGCLVWSMVLGVIIKKYCIFVVQ